MREPILMGLLLGGLVLILIVGGVALVWTRKLNDRDLNRHAMLAGTLTAATGLWLVQRSKLALDLQAIDLAVALVLVFVLSYIFFWVCINWALNRQRDSTDFKESSALSMYSMYMDSRQESVDFQPTELLAPQSKDAGKGRK